MAGKDSDDIDALNNALMRLSKRGKRSSEFTLTDLINRVDQSKDETEKDDIVGNDDGPNHSRSKLLKVLRKWNATEIFRVRNPRVNKHRLELHKQSKDNAEKIVKSQLYFAQVFANFKEFSVITGYGSGGHGKPSIKPMVEKLSNTLGLDCKPAKTKGKKTNQKPMVEKLSKNLGPDCKPAKKKGKKTNQGKLKITLNDNYIVNI